MRRIAVLASGGLDSSVLLADLSRDAQVFPLYIAMGLAWETEERRALQAFIAALQSPNVQSVTTVSFDIAPLYANHWSLTGQGIPGTETDDDAVFLPGRNILLLSLAAVWCATHDVHTIAIGSLGGNPFPDASPEFFRAFGGIVGQGLAHRIEIITPYRGFHKEDLVRCFRDAPLHLTLTCLQPHDGRHCGECNKCEERRRAFRMAGLVDHTNYAKR